MIETVLTEYPHLCAEVIVRRIPVLNDATKDDAAQVGIDKILPVINNGTGIAGTCLELISEEALSKINKADVIIAKGQGNFETMRYCVKNVYYIFMCKCQMFADRFNVPLYSGMLVTDLRLS